MDPWTNNLSFLKIEKAKVSLLLEKNETAKNDFESKENCKKISRQPELQKFLSMGSTKPWDFLLDPDKPGAVSVRRMMDPILIPIFLAIISSTLEFKHAIG